VSCNPEISRKQVKIEDKIIQEEEKLKALQYVLSLLYLREFEKVRKKRGSFDFLSYGVEKEEEKEKCLQE